MSINKKKKTVPRNRRSLIDWLRREKIYAANARVWLDGNGWKSCLSLPDECGFLVLFMDSKSIAAYNADVLFTFSYSRINEALIYFEMLLESYG